jgi:hypothetical protein
VSFRWLLCGALLAIPVLAQQSASSAAPAAQYSAATEIKVECLPASRAGELLDKHGCVAGKVFRVTTPQNGTTHISLCPPKSGCSFHAVVFASDREKVGDLSYLHGKFVAFVGDITNYRGHPEIVIKDRQQVQVAASDPPPQFDAAQPKPINNGAASRSNTRGRAW